MKLIPSFISKQLINSDIFGYSYSLQFSKEHKDNFKTAPGGLLTLLIYGLASQQLYKKTKSMILCTNDQVLHNQTITNFDHLGKV